MKTNRMIWNIGRYMCLALLVAFAACTRDEFAETTTVQYEKGLCFSLYADGDMQLADTRTAGENALNENRISTVDIFLFKNDGSLNAGGYAHAEVTTSNEVVYLYKGSEWLANFNEQEGPYTVYALANYKGEVLLSNVQSLDDLKAVVAKDEDVVKWEGMSGYQGKTFLMDGKQTVTYAELQSVQNSGQPYVANVPVSRAAVKIELTLKFSDDWAPKFMATGLEAQLSNYATVTPALAEGNPLDGDQRGLSNYPGLSGDAVDNFSLDPVFFKPETTYNGSKIRFYTYVNRWDDFINNETMLLIDLPGYYNELGTPDPQDSEQFLDHNFYKVPIINNAEPQVLQRNTFYQITAVVDMKGTAIIDEPVVLTDVQFQTADWEVNEVDGGDVNANYLMLNQYYVDIRNADGYDGLEFYSSSPIEKVEIVGFENLKAAKDADIDFPYPGEPQPGAAIEIPGVYFVNKYNQRQEVDESDPNKDNLPEDPSTYDDEIRVDWDKNVTNGKIYLTSTNPGNVSKRYITLKVTNTDGLSKYVVVEQYPLEYIQPIPGYYSYRSDFISQMAIVNTITCHYESVFYTYGPNLPGTISYYIFRQEKSSESMEFQSKVVEDEKILKYKFESEYGTADWGVGPIPCYIWRAISDKNSFSAEFNNNMMYSVSITQTDDRYKLAYPLRIEKFNIYCIGHMYETAISSEENDRLISPNFTLASQLGYVTSTNKGQNFWEFAELHCGEYVETYQDEEGNTVVFDNWRLPTSAEIEVILRYQNDSKTKDVMDEVLTEDYYYVCWDGAMEGSGLAHNPNGNGNGLKAVRCVRDLLPEEFKN